MRRLLGTLLLSLCFPAAVLAQSGVEIRIDPPAPTSRTPITATISGLWGDGCPPQAPSVSVSGGTIRISLSVSQHPCPILPLRPIQWKANAFIGVLAPGDYEIEAAVPFTSIGFIARSRVRVHDADPEVRVFPRVIRTTGVRVYVQAPSISGCPPNVSPCPSPVVEFHGIPSPEVTLSNDTIIAVVPQVALPSPVEVAVRAYVGHEQRTYRTPAALFIKPDSVYDPALYERRLVPVFFRGPGAFGSQWVTDLWIENASDREIHLLQSPFPGLPCAAPLDCSHPLLPHSVERVPDRNQPGGFYFHPPRDASNDVRANALVRDLSRQAEALGAELPIARERDFRERVMLLNIPSDRRFRVALRIYSHPGTFAFDVPVKIYDMGSGTLLHDGAVTLRPPAAPIGEEPMNFTYTDLLAQLSIVAQDSLRVEVGREGLIREVWAFAAVTNNETQHVTTISPQ